MLAHPMLHMMTALALVSDSIWRSKMQERTRPGQGETGTQQPGRPTEEGEIGKQGGQGEIGKQGGDWEREKKSGESGGTQPNR
jgi:hypothetical protein